MAAARAGSGSISAAAGAARSCREEATSIDPAAAAAWLELWYQPKIDLRRKCLAGAEALARLHHPDGRVLLPDAFLAEVDNRYLIRLAEFALISALEDWHAFDAAGFNLRLAINVPVSALIALPIADIVAAHRPAAAHWPGLTVEVSEEQIVRHIKAAQEIARRLQASRVAVSIDDFGAGYSSFASLRDLAFAEIKLNQSFVHGCAVDTTNAAICQTAIDLAHRFASFAVAEGIESLADLEALQIMGCDFGQGTVLAPPMRKERMIALLQTRARRAPAAPAASEGTPSAAVRA